METDEHQIARKRAVENSLLAARAVVRARTHSNRPEDRRESNGFDDFSSHFDNWGDWSDARAPVMGESRGTEHFTDFQNWTDAT